MAGGGGRVLRWTARRLCRLRMPDLLEPLCDDRRRHGVVGLEKAAREVQSNRMPGREIEQNRARVPSECRTIVEQDVRFRFRQLTWCEPLLVEHVAEDRVHQLCIGRSAVPGWVADYGHLLRGLGRAPWKAESATPASVLAPHLHAGARSPAHRLLRCAGSRRSGTRARQAGQPPRENRSTRLPLKRVRS